VLRRRGILGFVSRVRVRGGGMRGVRARGVPRRSAEEEESGASDYPQRGTGYPRHPRRTACSGAPAGGRRNGVDPGILWMLLHPPPAPPRAAAAPTQWPRTHRAEQRRRRGADAGRRHHRYRRSPSSPPPLQRPRRRRSPPSAHARRIRLPCLRFSSSSRSLSSASPSAGEGGTGAGEGGACSAVGAMEDDEPRWRTHTSREQGRTSLLPLVQGSAPSAARLHGHRACLPPPRRKQRRSGWSRVGELDHAPGSGELEGAEPRIERLSTESSPCSSRAGRGSRGMKHQGGEPPPA
jgi:hypothetical protein